MLGVLGDEPNRILISPLGWGPANLSIDWGARDVLDALADVEATYQIDQDAVLVSGYSMGGQGTLQLATWFPDRFAGGMQWVGPTGDCRNGTPLAQRHNGCPFDIQGSTLDFLQNTRHVPIAHLYGAADEFVQANHGVAIGQRMAELGYRHRLWLHAAEHLTFIVLGDWRKEAAWTSDLRRIQRPATVTYRTNTYLWVPELDLVPDGAYWLDELRPRNDSPTPEGDMVADLTSHACPEGHRQEVTIRRDAGTDPVP